MRWQEEIPLRGISARQVANDTIPIWTCTDISKEVLTDCGIQFVSGLFERVHKMLNINIITTSPYHPECNGVLEYAWNIGKYFDKGKGRRSSMARCLANGTACTQRYAKS